MPTLRTGSKGMRNFPRVTPIEGQHWIRNFLQILCFYLFLFKKVIICSLLMILHRSFWGKKNENTANITILFTEWEE